MTEGEESLSQSAMDAVFALLVQDPDKRIKLDGLKGLELFQGLNWGNLLEQEAPFVPMPDDASDTTYFNQRNVMQGLTVSEVDL